MSHDLDLGKRLQLRHTLATLAYRAAKVARNAPPGFAAFTIGPGTRTPLLIVAHLADLIEWAIALSRGHATWRTAAPVSWDAEIERLFANLEDWDRQLAADVALVATPEQLFQGPIADALTHVGQLAMLRRLAGTPVRGENYFRADISCGRVGVEQPPPRFEFD